MRVRRFGGCAVGALGVCLTAQPFNRLLAQHVSIGPQVVFGDYREVPADPRCQGSGLGGRATLSWKKFSVGALLSKVKSEPKDTIAATTPFDASEVDVRLRYYISGPVSAELGFMNPSSE